MPKPVTLDFIQDLVREVAVKNPQGLAARARHRAAESAVSGVRLWQDPNIGLGVTGASRSLREENGDARIGVEQVLPRPKQIHFQRRQVEAEARAREAQKRDVLRELGLRVGIEVLGLAFADEALAIQGEEVRWLETMAKAAQERSKNPDASAAEALRLETELLVRSEKWKAAQSQRTQMMQSLDLLLGRSRGLPWPRLSLPGASLGSLSGTAVGSELQKNPRIEGLRHEWESLEAAVEVSKERGKPTLSVGLETNLYSRGEFRDAMVSVRMSVPWVNRGVYRAETLRAMHAREAAAHDIAAAAQALETELGRYVTEADNNARLARAYEMEILPRAQKTLEIRQDAWISSKISLLEVLDARRALLEARLDFKRALAAHHSALSRVRNLTGDGLPR